MTEAKSVNHLDHDYGPTVGEITSNNPKFVTRNVDVFYGDKQAIFDASLDIGNNEVVACPQWEPARRRGNDTSASIL